MIACTVPANQFDPTVLELLERFVELRRQARYRNVRSERLIVRTHVASDPIAPRRVRELDERVMRAWWDRVITRPATTPHQLRGAPACGAPRPLSLRTARNVLTLVRCAIRYAVQLGLLERDVTTGLSAPRALGATTSLELEGVLEGHEQVRLLDVLEQIARRAMVSAIERPGALRRAFEAHAVYSMVRLALGAGLRRTELLELRWGDVMLEGPAPHLVVRYGGRGGQATKAGKPRRVPLFGLALEGLRAWRGAALRPRVQSSDANDEPRERSKHEAPAAAPRAIGGDGRMRVVRQTGGGQAPLRMGAAPDLLEAVRGVPREEPTALRGPSELTSAAAHLSASSLTSPPSADGVLVTRADGARRMDPGALVFPGTGGRRRKRPPVRELAEALRWAGVRRRVRWHDLRHSCATSLLEGTWGRAWSTQEVQQLLGHSSVLTTERYIHARGRLVFRAAAEAGRDPVRESSVFRAARAQSDERVIQINDGAENLYGCACLGRNGEQDGRALFLSERDTGLEPATFGLGSRRSTN